MIPATRAAILAGLLSAGGSASADEVSFPRTPYPLEHCLEKVLGALPSTILSVEREVKMGVPYFEFEVRTRADRTRWEVECNADTGEITQIERDVPPDDPAFASIALLPQGEAVRIALAHVHGTPKGVEHEVSPDGRAWYEITVEGVDGVTREVMVDAKSGAVLGIDDDRDSRTLYRIGVEPD